MSQSAASLQLPDPSLVASALKKATTRLMPMMLLMYVIAFIDRSNLGWAQQAWEADHGISAASYTFGATLFFIGYAVFEVPSNLIMHKVGARWWMTRIMFTWGLIAAAFMFVDGPTMFYVLRFLLGVAEAGFFPGIMLYLTYWYPAARRGWATGLFYMGLPLANMLGNPLSGALLEMHGFGGLAGHQWMFLIEGGMAVVVSFFVPFILTDRPAKAKWLSAGERDALVRQIEIEDAAKEKAKSISWRQAMVDPRILYFCLIYMCIQASVYGLTFFLPKQVTTMTGQSVGFQASLITAIPWAAALIGVLFIPKAADRTGKYRTFAGVLILMSGVGIAMSGIFLQSTVPAMIGLSIAAIGFVSAQPIFWQLPTRYLSGAALAGATGLVNAVGNLGGWLAPNIRTWATLTFAHGDTPNEAAGLYALAMAGFIGCLLIVGLAVFFKGTKEEAIAAQVQSGTLH